MGRSYAIGQREGEGAGGLFHPLSPLVLASYLPPVPRPVVQVLLAGPVQQFKRQDLLPQRAQRTAEDCTVPFVPRHG